MALRDALAVVWHGPSEAFKDIWHGFLVALTCRCAYTFWREALS